MVLADLLMEVTGMIVKAKRQGGVTFLTIPKSLGVAIGTEFNVYQDDIGSIIYEPIIKKNSCGLWSDTQLNEIEADKLRQVELSDHGYNPHETLSVGKEREK